MRIALVHPRASTLGGVEHKSHAIAVAALDAGHEVHFFCERAAPDVDARLRVHRLPNPFRGLPALKVWHFDRVSQRAVAHAGPFDVVHGFGKTSRQDVYSDGSGCLADFQRYSIDTLPHAWQRSWRRHSPHQRVVARIERARYAPGSCRRVLAISKLVREQILRRYPLRPEDVELHYPGVDLARFRPVDGAAARAASRRALGLGDGGPLLVFVGSEYRRKNLGTVLRALVRLPEASLAVIGAERPANVARHREDAARLGVAERCHFLGTRRDPERYLAASDVLVFPTHFDAFGRVVLESLACGTPAVVSASAGAAELVREGETGAVLRDPGDAEALAAALAPLLAPERREPAGERARRDAERFPWSRHVARVLEVYEELVPRVAGPVRVCP